MFGGGNNSGATTRDIGHGGDSPFPCFFLVRGDKNSGSPSARTAAIDGSRERWPVRAGGSGGGAVASEGSRDGGHGGL
jgi:hypothetical protein